MSGTKHSGLDWLSAKASADRDPEVRLRRSELDRKLREAFEQGRAAQVKESSRRQAELDELEASVRIHACADEQFKIALSQQNNLCWHCHTRTPDPTDAYQRCSACVAKADD